MTDTGIDVQTISVERKSRRNTKMIRTTRMPPIIACSCTLLMAREMKSELSCVTVILMPGTSLLTRSTSARTSSATVDGVLAGLLLHLDLDARACR